jgi:hypothetical protein
MIFGGDGREREGRDWGKKLEPKGNEEMRRRI